MTRFTDGPAKGQVLMLKRAARFLRVVQSSAGTWDALDQPDDSPAPDETLYAYTIVGQPLMCHINRGSKGSGFYPAADYRLCEIQPSDPEMRSIKLWGEWCERNK